MLAGLRGLPYSDIKHACKERTPCLARVQWYYDQQKQGTRRDMDRSIDKILPRTGDEGYSRISVLHEDVLLQIFLANTVMSHKSRLATTRFTSHVCRDWRAVMLHSPVIWGRLIDLEGLTDNTHDWMREVISRSGTALLWINGPIFCGRIRNETPTPEFIFTLIKESWPRIQRMNIAVVFKDISDAEDDIVYTQYWTTLLDRPAPNLEEFVFDYRLKPYDVTTNRWTPPTLLFNSISPVLRKTQVYRFDDSVRLANRPEALPLGMPVSWLSRLRFLSLRSNCKWDVFQFMQLLNVTPFLEELEVFHLLKGDLDKSDVPLIKLPQLTRFHFGYCGILPLVILLESISPSTHFCLSIAEPCYPSSYFMTPHEEEPESPYLERFYTHVMKYVYAYFRQNPATYISLGYSCADEMFEVEDKTPFHETESSGWSHRLSISIPLESDYADVAHDTINDFSLFSSVQQLDIYDWYDEKNHFICLSAFQSVTTLIAGAHNIDHMMEDGCAGAELPRLRVLQIGRVSEFPQPLYEVGPDCRDLLPLFLLRRKDVGLPLSVLDLSAVKPYKLRCDLDNLEEFDGLLVRWRSSKGNTKEYVCGSGRPQELCFVDERAVKREARMQPNAREKIYGWSGHL